MFSYWVKLSTLVMALVVSVFSIIWLKQGHSSKFMNSLGFNNNGQILNWCDSRVKTMTFPQPVNASITEKAGKWLWQRKASLTIDYLSIEKWLAKYCQIPIKKIEFNDFESPMTPLLEVEFVSGENITFYDLGNNRIQVQDQIFSSPLLKDALKELLAFGPKIE